MFDVCNKGMSPFKCMKSGVAEEAGEPRSYVVNGLVSTTARWVAHLGHTSGDNG